MIKQNLIVGWLMVCCVCWPMCLEAQRARNTLRETRDEFFATEEARRVGDQLLLYQRNTGGWPKNINMTKPLSPEEKARVLKDKSRRDDSTTDNGATNWQMRYLARLYQATGDKKYAKAFCKGVAYLLSGQYENGGWPQFWPEKRGYQEHITYNDDAMVNTMNLLREIYEQQAPFQGDLCSASLRRRVKQAYQKGVECILATQIVVDGKPTIWCQQHDCKSFAPAPARSYELASFCPQESAALVKLLMSLPDPNEQVKQAVHAAMAWFDGYKLTGWRYVRNGRWEDGSVDSRLMVDSLAGPLWARFYDLTTIQPYVSDRDGKPKHHLHDIGSERRNGYSWFGTRPAELYPLYESWAEQYDPEHRVSIDLHTKGMNEQGQVLFTPDK